jgi:hypothetical protein
MPYYSRAAALERRLLHDTYKCSFLVLLLRPSACCCIASKDEQHCNPLVMLLTPPPLPSPLQPSAHQFLLATTFWRPGNLNLARRRASAAYSNTQQGRDMSRYDEQARG